MTGLFGYDEDKRRLAALLLVAAAALCLVGAFRLPFTHSEFTLALPGWMPSPMASRVRLWLIEKGRIPVGDQYLWGVIRKLFTAHEYFVGWAILLFSVVFPVIKLALCTVLAGCASFLSAHSRHSIHRALTLTGKWSMADVFIVGMIIVFFKAEGFHYTFAARPGIYCYACSAVLSSVAVSVVGRTLRESEEPALRMERELR